MLGLKKEKQLLRDAWQPCFSSKITAQPWLSGTSTAIVVAERVRDTDASYYLGLLAYSTLETAILAWLDKKPMQYQNLKNFIISVCSQKCKSVPGNRNVEEGERESNTEKEKRRL